MQAHGAALECLLVCCAVGSDVHLHLLLLLLLTRLRTCAGRAVCRELGGQLSLVQAGGR